MYKRFLTVLIHILLNLSLSLCTVCSLFRSAVITVKVIAVDFASLLHLTSHRLCLI